jgi:hypothetical protein
MRQLQGIGRLSIRICIGERNENPIGQELLSLNHYQSSTSADADEFFDHTTMIPFTVNQMNVDI